MEQTKTTCSIGICDINGCVVVPAPCPHAVPALGAAALGLTVALVAVVAWIVRGRDV